MTHVEAQLHRRRRRVDVLAPRPRGARKTFLDLGRIDRQRARNPDRRGPVDRRGHHSRPPARRSVASIVGRPDWRADDTRVRAREAPPLVAGPFSCRPPAPPAHPPPATPPTAAPPPLLLPPA